jgi:3-oxoacyl-[acyl-carrier protein] reductase
MLLKNKVALVTGASRGIGRSIAKHYALHGAIVYANARTEGSLDGLIDEARELYGTTIHPLYFDVTDTATVKTKIMSIKKTEGQIDAVVNNAGIMKDALIGMIPSDTMREVFEVNVFAVMEIVQLAARLMMKQESGSIINLASIVGQQGNKGQLVYSASKGAVAALTKSAAKELARYNIRVNAVAPGMIDTEMLRSIGVEWVSERIAGISAGRLGTPDEVADTCVFLASDLARYVTGQILGVDGAAII